jgi:hypothetical protein
VQDEIGEGATDVEADAPAASRGSRGRCHG